GFGKNLEHNLTIIRRLREFKSLGCPILIGTSRKSFIGMTTGLAVSERVEGSIASISVAIANGADIVRVHDVKESKRAVNVCDAILRRRLR
ncbi:MAG: dihydropteroate synthase, partial [Thermoplasmata archaeon]